MNKPEDDNRHLQEKPFAHEEFEPPSIIEYPKPFDTVEQAESYGWRREELHIFADGRATPICQQTPTENSTEIEREALHLINLARESYRTKAGEDTPPLQIVPRTDAELHAALDCLPVRRPTEELMFDGSVRRLAQLCADAWGTGIDHGDFAFLEFTDGQNALVRAAAVKLPPALVALARLHNLGDDNI